MSTSAITLTYVAFNVVCFAVGASFILLKGSFQVLGISLVVGGIFSFGTFMAQWWDHSWQIGRNVLDRAFSFEDRDIRYAELRRLAKRFSELQQEFDDLPGTPGANGRGDVGVAVGRARS